MKSQKSIRNTKAVHILHLEQAVNKMNLLNFPNYKETFNPSRPIRSDIKYNINTRIPLMKQRISVDQIQSSRSNYIKSYSKQKKVKEQHSSSQLQLKIQQLQREIEQVKKTKKNEYPKPIIFAIQKIGIMKKLRIFQKDPKDMLLIIDSKNGYRTEKLNKTPDHSPDKQIAIDQSVKHIFLKNVFENKYEEPSISAPTTPPEIKAKLLRVPQKAQIRSSSQGQINRKRIHNLWPTNVQEFSGWDIKEDNDDSRLG